MASTEHLLPSKKRPCLFDLPSSPKRLSSAASSFLEDLSEFDASLDFPSSFSSSQEKLLSEMMRNLEEVLQGAGAVPLAEPGVLAVSDTRLSVDASVVSGSVGSEFFPIESSDALLMDLLEVSKDELSPPSSASSVCEALFDSPVHLQIVQDQLHACEWPVLFEDLDSSDVFDGDFEQSLEETSHVAEMSPLF